MFLRNIYRSMKNEMTISSRTTVKSINSWAQAGWEKRKREAAILARLQAAIREIEAKARK